MGQDGKNSRLTYEAMSRRVLFGNVRQPPFWHYKAWVTQHSSFWIDMDKNFSNNVNIQSGIKFYCTNLPVFNSFYSSNYFRKCIQINIDIIFGIFCFKRTLFEFWFKENWNIQNPPFVFQMRCALNNKAPTSIFRKWFVPYLKYITFEPFLSRNLI